MNKEEIKELFSNRNFDRESAEYLAFHASRYASLLNMIKGLKKSDNNSNEILDIGPSFFTELLINSFPDDKISILGFGQEEQFRGGHFPKEINLTGHHAYIEFDLNNSALDKNFIIKARFDIIIIAEVIEHLSVSPKLVLGFLKNLLKENGVIIIQTPNALSIDKRIAILRGIHPYEMIRESKTNPGHFREYAYYELSKILQQLGMKIVKLSFFNYQPPKPHGVKGKILDLFYKLIKRIKPELQDSITLIASRES